MTSLAKSHPQWTPFFTSTDPGLCELFESDCNAPTIFIYSSQNALPYTPTLPPLHSASSDAADIPSSNDTRAFEQWVIHNRFPIFFSLADAEVSDIRMDDRLILVALVPQKERAIFIRLVLFFSFPSTFFI